jgi:hypothetical protein
VDELDEPPLPQITVNNVDDSPRQNIGDLTDHDDQKLAVMAGISPTEWAELSEEQRVGQLRGLAPVRKKPEGQTGPSVRKLSNTEKRILAHCRRKAHKGERIALHLGLSYDHTRRVLARLVTEGHLLNNDRGYRTV